MNTVSTSLSISQEYEIAGICKERAYPIPVSEWIYLKNKINKICSPKLLYHTLGSIFLSISGSAILVITTLPKPDSKVPSDVIIWILAIFIVTLIVGLFALHFSSLQKKETLASKEDVLEEMERLAQRYDKHAYIASEENSIIIVAAQYGSINNSIDVTKNLIECVKDGKLNIVASNRNFGDPHPGVKKKLQVRYMINGQEESKEWPENSIVNIPE